MASEPIFVHLTDFFAQRGFVARPASSQFRQTTPTGFVSVIASVSAGTPPLLTLHLGARHEAVEQLVAPWGLTSAAYQLDATTVICSEGTLRGLPTFRHRLDTPAAVVPVAGQVRDFMRTTGLGFLDLAANLSTLNQLLNGDVTPQSPYFYNPVHRCFRSVAVAALAGDPRLPALLATYFGVLQAAQPASDWLERYLRFLQQIEESFATG